MRKRRPLSHGKVDEEENGGEQRRMDTKEVAGRHEEPLRTQAFRHSGKDRANAVRRMTGEYEARRGGEEKSESIECILPQELEERREEDEEEQEENTRCFTAKKESLSGEPRSEEEDKKKKKKKKKTKKKKEEGKEKREREEEEEEEKKKKTKKKKNEISSFCLFLTPEIDKILEETNRESLRKYGRHSWKRMDEIDLHAYMGLLILAAVYRSRGEAPASLWDAESGRAIFRATMSLKVFHIYSKLVRFDDRKTRVDKLASWVACKARSSYAWKMQVYTGKKPNTAAGRGGEEEEGRKKGKGRGGSEKNQAMRLVLNVTEGLTGRNIICDNFFTSYKLAQRLLLEKNKTLLGTIRKNKPELPDALLALHVFILHTLVNSQHTLILVFDTQTHCSIRQDVLTR
ncbi:hypothetical protein D5F01_LYC23748 [Larimichthys crocea]|uniref:PiggyBac transposable element-derived protein domain-containing protein n=1 Tax=Larimichthys crocea TaxID=215358 RepID=A0A6G0HG50_LARCR|nr:hypothetical protein D5F01_LYC23748 [Larimichthys crocea]